MASSLLRCRACRQPVLSDARCCPHCAAAGPIAPQAIGLWIACVALTALGGYLAYQPDRSAATAKATLAAWPNGDRVPEAGLRACPRIEDSRVGGKDCPTLPGGTRVREVATATYAGVRVACLSADGRESCLWVMRPPHR